MDAKAQQQAAEDPGQNLSQISKQKAKQMNVSILLLNQNATLAAMTVAAVEQHSDASTSISSNTPRHGAKSHHHHHHHHHHHKHSETFRQSQVYHHHESQNNLQSHTPDTTKTLINQHFFSTPPQSTEKKKQPTTTENKQPHSTTLNKNQESEFVTKRYDDQTSSLVEMLQKPQEKSNKPKIKKKICNPENIIVNGKREVIEDMGILSEGIEGAVKKGGVDALVVHNEDDQQEEDEYDSQSGAYYNHKRQKKPQYNYCVNQAKQHNQSELFGLTLPARVQSQVFKQNQIISSLKSQQPHQKGINRSCAYPQHSPNMLSEDAKNQNSRTVQEQKHKREENIKTQVFPQILNQMQNRKGSFSPFQNGFVNQNEGNNMKFYQQQFHQHQNNSDFYENKKGSKHNKKAKKKSINLHSSNHHELEQSQQAFSPQFNHMLQSQQQNFYLNSHSEQQEKFNQHAPSPRHSTFYHPPQYHQKGSSTKEFYHDQQQQQQQQHPQSPSHNHHHHHHHLQQSIQSRKDNSIQHNRRKKQRVKNHQHHSHQHHSHQYHSQHHSHHQRSKNKIPYEQEGFTSSDSNSNIFNEHLDKMMNTWTSIVQKQADMMFKYNTEIMNNVVKYILFPHGNGTQRKGGDHYPQTHYSHQNHLYQGQYHNNNHHRQINNHQPHNHHHHNHNPNRGGGGGGGASHDNHHQTLNLIDISSHHINDYHHQFNNFEGVDIVGVDDDDDYYQQMKTQEQSQ